MNIIVFIIGFIIGIMLTLVAYHKHPVRIIREQVKSIIKAFNDFKHRHAGSVPLTGESANGEISDFIKRDMKAYGCMREHRIHQYDRNLPRMPLLLKHGVKRRLINEL